MFVRMANTFFFLFSNKMLVICVVIYKMSVRKATIFSFCFKQIVGYLGWNSQISCQNDKHFSLYVFKQIVGYLGWNSQNAYQSGKQYFLSVYQTNC